MTKKTIITKEETCSSSSSKIENPFKLTVNSPLYKYKIHDSFWFLDSASQSERLHTYSIGYNIFKNHNKNFTDFKNFHQYRQIFLFTINLLFLLLVIRAAYLILIQNFTFWEFQAAFLILISSTIFLFWIFKDPLQNVRKIHSYFAYIDPDKKPYNFKAFVKLSGSNKEEIESFSNKVDNRHDFPEEEKSYIPELLALDFVFGGYGSIKNYFEKIIPNDTSLTKSGAEKFFGKLIGTSRSSVRRYYETKPIEEMSVKEIENFCKHLIAAKEILRENDLGKKSKEVENLLANLGADSHK